MSASVGTLYGNYGENVEQLVYSAARGRWILTESTQYIVNLNIFYDQAYAEKYANAEERILANAKNLQEFYFSNFNIFVNYSIPQQFVSTADTCDGNVCICQSGECHTAPQIENNWHTINGDIIHHKNFAYLAHNAYDMVKTNYPGYKNNAATLIFTGHDDACIQVQVTENGRLFYEEKTNIAGACFKTIRTMIIMDSDYSMNLTAQDEEKIVTIHEFGHLYDDWQITGDHDDGSVTLTDFSDDCTYGVNSRQLTCPTICQGCRNRILGYRERYKHSLEVCS